MDFSFFLVAAFLGCFKYVSYAQKARVTIPPEPVNAGLNKTVNFTCTAIAEDIRWRVNGATINPDLRSRGFDDSSSPVTLNATQHLQMSTLTVFGSADNNGTNITCVVIFFSSLSSEESEATVLLVFEPGSQQVSNLIVTLINSTTVLISWSPPFTLKGVPILGYNVTITNTISGENETMLVGDTTLLYFIDHPDPENSFTVTVVPINEVGAGQPLNSEPFLFPLPETSLSSSSVPEATTTTLENSKDSLTIINLTLMNISSISSVVFIETALPTPTPSAIPTNFQVWIIGAVLAPSLFIVILSLTVVVVVVLLQFHHSKMKSARMRNGTYSMEYLKEAQGVNIKSLDLSLEGNETTDGLHTRAFETSEKVDSVNEKNTTSPSTNDVKKSQSLSMSHYADLGDFNKEKPGPIAPVPLEKVVYASITHEHTCGNFGDKKRQDPIYGVPTEEEREEVAHTVQHKWRLIGLQLGIEAECLDGIAEGFSPDNHAQCSSELFRRWATNELSADYPFMWEKLIEILNAFLVRETTLARELEKRIRSVQNNNIKH